jgi:hypothetical protein
MIEILVNNLILAITLIVPVLAYECCVVSCTCPQAIWGTIIIYVVFNFLLFCFIFDTYIREHPMDNSMSKKSYK